jgi:hypothetical protein
MELSRTSPCAGFWLRACVGRATFDFYRDGIYVSGDLWGYWRATFPRGSVDDMFVSMVCNIDDGCAEFTRSLVWRGSMP